MLQWAFEICFLVTWSPLVLSDIPSNRVLYMNPQHLVSIAFVGQTSEEQCAPSIYFLFTRLNCLAIHVQQSATEYTGVPKLACVSATRSRG